MIPARPGGEDARGLDVGASAGPASPQCGVRGGAASAKGVEVRQRFGL
jgi:hypothetical protein